MRRLTFPRGRMHIYYYYVCIIPSSVSPIRLRGGCVSCALLLYSERLSAENGQVHRFFLACAEFSLRFPSTDGRE